MRFTIRPAAEADLSVLSQLARETWVESFGHSFTPDDLRGHVERELSREAFEAILERDLVLVAESEDGLEGFVQMGARTCGSEVDADAELCRLYVRADHRSQGVGRALVEAVLTHPRFARARSVALDVWSENHAAQRFYRRLGFEPVGERRFEVASGAETTPDLIMVRRQDVS